MESVFTSASEKMEKTINVLRSDFKTIRAGRANAAVLDRIQVDYYGVPTAINQMAAVSVPEPALLTIQPWDASALKLIEKAILASDIGINPQNDGKVIRLAFPSLTEDRRKELCRDIKKMGEDSKVAIRSIRRDAIEKLKAMKKAGEITEDDLKQAEKRMQDITDKFIARIDEECAIKEKEIMAI
ncbi:MAG: ribosome recycling factor [Ruminococcaceae bacterium]|nr:ribosome recycling factor [Oscillospiraceae bacterium]